MSTKNLWLKSYKFDFFFFIGSGFLCLLLLIPYQIWGASVVIPIYTIYLVFFGLPHNYLTWAATLPKNSRPTYKFSRIKELIAISFFITLLLPLSYGTEFSDWVLSAIAILSIWHVLKQHFGICKMYDGVQSKRTKDYSLFKARKWLDHFFIVSSMGVIVWVFTFDDVYFLMSSDEKYRFIHPVVPKNIFNAYLGWMFIAGVMGLKHSVYDRIKEGKFVPWPQVFLVFTALITFWGPYLFIPLSAMPLAMAIATIFHNIQYFGFVWIFEKERALEMSKNNVDISWTQKLALKGAWKTYFTWSAAFSFVIIALYSTVPKLLGMFLIYFIGVSHYIVDGHIWKIKANNFLGRFLDNLSGLSPLKTNIDFRKIAKKQTLPNPTIDLF